MRAELGVTFEHYRVWPPKVEDMFSDLSRPQLPLLGISPHFPLSQMAKGSIRHLPDCDAGISLAMSAGVTLYAVGVGKAIEEELQEIASAPPDRHLFYAEDFSTMGQISDKLKKGICQGTYQAGHPGALRPQARAILEKCSCISQR